MNPASYFVHDAPGLLTPALAIYPQFVEANIANTIRLLERRPERWRPHVKTAKLGFVMRRMVAQGITSCKASTTLEVAAAADSGFTDILLAYPVVGANARRAIELAVSRPSARLSVLVENKAQVEQWRGSPVGLFIDVNTGMNRTGVEQDHIDEVVALARTCGAAFRGLHYYDGHLHQSDLNERAAAAHAGYDRLMRLVAALGMAGLPEPEIITSGTPAFPFAVSFEPFRTMRHQVSPGTVVYNDMSSLRDLPDYGYAPAALVLATVVSHPRPGRFTCDAGHKSVSADAGIPTCSVLGRPDLIPAGPSEEHLPVDGPGDLPAIGEQLCLLPRHVCPTVNNFDDALIVESGRIAAVERVTARGHESYLLTRAPRATP